LSCPTGCTTCIQNNVKTFLCDACDDGYRLKDTKTDCEKVPVMTKILSKTKEILIVVAVVTLVVVIIIIFACYKGCDKLKDCLGKSGEKVKG
jgi:hypothetical protein